MSTADPMPRESRAAAPRASRSAATRARIMDAAESLIASHGLEGVSLRQIRLAVGSANTNVVAYHFGNWDGLIEAIVMDRHPRLEQARARLLEEADAYARGHDVAVLLQAIWRPYFDIRNAAGRHAYASFLANINRQAEVWPGERLSRHFPIEAELRRRIFDQLPNVQHRIFSYRIWIVFAMITAALRSCDESFPEDPERAGALFEAAIRMGVAAMLTP